MACPSPDSRTLNPHTAYLPRNAYNMVLHKYGELLYSGLKTTLTQQLRRIADHVQDHEGERFLLKLKERWDLHSKSIQMVRDILMVITWGQAEFTSPAAMRRRMLNRGGRLTSSLCTPCAVHGQNFCGSASEDARVPARPGAVAGTRCAGPPHPAAPAGRPAGAGAQGAQRGRHQQQHI